MTAKNLVAELRELREENRRLRERIRALETKRAVKKKPSEVPDAPQVLRVLQASAAYFGTTAENVVRGGRFPALVRARVIGMVVAKKLYPWVSTNTLGAAYDCNHTSVLNKLHWAEEHENEIRDDVENLIKKLTRK